MTPKLLRYLYLSLCILFTTGCRDSLTDTAAIPLDNSDNTLPPEDIIRVDSWTKLADEDDAMIANIRKFSVVDGHCYILDGRESKLLIFNSDGSFAGSVGKRGNGPGEYPFAYDFTVNPDSQQIVILSNQSTIYIYTLRGAFIGKHKLAAAEISDIAYIDGRYVATTAYSSFPPGENENSPLLYEFDADFNCAAQWLPYDSPLLPLHSVFKNRLQRVGSHMYYVDNLHTEVLKIPADTSGTPETVLTYHLPDPMPLDVYADMATFMSKQREHDWLADVILSPDAILTAYISTGDYRVSLNRWDGTTIKSGRYRGTLPETFCTPDGTMYSIITPEQYLQSWQSLNIPQPAATPTDESNPLLLRWHLSL